jgi:glycosyltransferase involved in cell wall biosynthesis
MGNVNSHHAALAYWESGKLESFCVPWFPEKWELGILKAMPGLEKEFEQLARRRFEPLVTAPRVQGRLGEWTRLLRRKMGGGEELSYEANDWLMKIMAKECDRQSVTAVHSYEDCSLEQFQSAQRKSKVCIYDMPTTCYEWRRKNENELAKKYKQWLPPMGISSHHWARPYQKRKEMELADLVLVPSTFSQKTIQRYFDKKVLVASYGVDVPKELQVMQKKDDIFRIVFAGTICVQKGIPLLLETWKRLGWSKSELILVGTWQLAEDARKKLPRGVRYIGQVSQIELMKNFLKSDWLVFPSNSEGYGLVILEALAHGLPVLASTATGAADLPASEAIRLFEPENSEQLAEALIAAKAAKGKDLTVEARRIAAECSWEKYRQKVRDAVQLLD